MIQTLSSAASTILENHLDTIHAGVAAALLLAIRQVDRLAQDEADHVELSGRKLGASSTVSAQHERYQSLSENDERIPISEVAGLLTLVGRRSDADLVLRRAGHLLSGLDGVDAKLSGLAKRKAKRKLVRVLDLRVEFHRERPVATAECTDLSPELQRLYCALRGAALVEVAHAVSGFEGALRHGSCVSNGAATCRWSVVAEA